MQSGTTTTLCMSYRERNIDTSVFIPESFDPSLRTRDRIALLALNATYFLRAFVQTAALG